MRKNDYIAKEQIGYYYREVKMVNMARVESHEYAQCGFKVENGNIDFYSYSSLLFRLPIDKMKLDSDRLECKCYFGEVAPYYSRTTMNHTRWFCEQINCNAGYHMLKTIYNEGDMDCIIFADKKQIEKILSLF